MPMSHQNNSSSISQYFDMTNEWKTFSENQILVNQLLLN